MHRPIEIQIVRIAESTIILTSPRLSARAPALAAPTAAAFTAAALAAALCHRHGGGRLGRSSGDSQREDLQVMRVGSPKQ